MLYPVILTTFLLSEYSLITYGQTDGACTDMNGTVVQNDESFYEEPCLICECLIIDGWDMEGPCTSETFVCPCETRCCQKNCPHQIEPDPKGQPLTSSSNFSIIMSVSIATVILVLGLLFYLYRKRATQYVRTTRRFYLDRQNSAKPSSMEEAPPNYEDIATDSRVHVTMPPRYEDIAPSYSFAVLQQQDLAESDNTISSPTEPPPVVQ